MRESSIAGIGVYIIGNDDPKKANRETDSTHVRENIPQAMSQEVKWQVSQGYLQKDNETVKALKKELNRKK